MKKTEMKDLIDRRLSGIRFERAEAVVQGLRQPLAVRPVRHMRLVPAAALILALLLAGAALALGLDLSARMDARQRAVDALEKAFGLNEETISLFDVQVEKEGADWLVRLVPKNVYPAQVGEYQVDIRPDRADTARWSLQDSPAYAPDKGLLSPVWGQQQLLEYKRAVQNYHDRLSLVDWSQAGKWSLEERARIDRFTQPAIPFGLEVYAQETHVVPGRDDLQPEEAWARAAQALADRYGLEPSAVNGMDRSCQSFMESREDKSRWYAMTFRVPGTSGEETDQESFYILLSSPSGEVLQAAWHQPDDSRRSLPKGDLSAYGEAVAEYMDTDAFLYLSASDKADLTGRMTAAGFGGLLQGAQYLTPGADHALEADAFNRAISALQAGFGLGDDSLALFIQSFSLQAVDGTPQWVLRLTPRRQYDWTIGSEAPLGEYTARLNARADRVLDARWSLEGVDDKLYTKSTWGQAKAYAGYILPWLEELMEETGAIRAAAQDPDFLSVEDAARFDGLYRAAGFPQERYNAGLPRAQDLNEQAAVNLALEALRTIYGLPADLKAHFDLIWPSYILRSGDRPFQSEEPVWIISFHRGDGIYVVALDAQTGQVLHVNYDPAASGNG